MKVCVFGFGPPNNKLHIHNQLAKERDIQMVAEPKESEKFTSVLRDNGGVDVAIVNINSGLETVQRISHMSGCKVIGVGDTNDAKMVIEAMRAGCCQFVPRPATIEDIRSAIDNIRVSEGVRASKRLCIVGSSGAAGATTVACHMAIEFGALAGSAAIVDLDLELGGVGTFFDIDPEHCLADACRNDVDITSLRRTMTDAGRVSILARPSNIGDIGEVSPDTLGKVFLSLAEIFPYVVVDMSRPNGELGQIAMQNADCVAIVAQANVMSIRNAVRVRAAAKASGVSDDRVKLILNRCGSACHRLGNAEIAEAFSGEVLANIPNDWAAVHECLDLGQALPDKSAARIEIRRAASRMIGKPETSIAEPPATVGRLKKLLVGLRG